MFGWYFIHIQIKVPSGGQRQEAVMAARSRAKIIYCNQLLKILYVIPD